MVNVFADQIFQIKFSIEFIQSESQRVKEYMKHSFFFK